MQEIEFNLLTEPWVRVRLPDNTVQEVSLTDALVHAQEYMDLAGEMPTQDAAMLRLLLAVLFTVFSRVNEVGEPEPLEDEEAALERWGSAVGTETFPGAAHPGLSGAVERPLLALPSGAAILAGAGGGYRHGVRRGKAERRDVGEQQ